MGTGNTEYIFTYGFVSTSTTSSTQEMETTMSLEMSRGVEHRGKTKEKKMNVSTQATTINQAEDTYQISGGATFTT